VLCSGTSLQSRKTECLASSRWALPCIIHHTRIYFPFVNIMFHLPLCRIIYIFCNNVQLFITCYRQRVYPICQYSMLFVLCIFTARHNVSAVCAVALSVGPSDTSRCCIETAEQIDLIVGTKATLGLYFVGRKFGFIQTHGYFPLEPCLKL